MTINGVSGVSAGTGTMGMNQTQDPESRELQRQIADAQKKLQELSSNEAMSKEEKMKKRQEIQKQISELNNQLRQHQMELRRQAAEKAKEQKEQNSGADDLTRQGNESGSTGKGRQAAGLSKNSMQAMISAEGSMEQAKVQGSVARQMEGKAGVLEIEIKLDSARGGSTEAKEEELEEVKEKAADATASQMSTLSAANETIRKAGEEEETEEKTREEKDKEKDEDSLTKSEGDEKTPEDAQKFLYTPVDVRL